MRSRPQRVSITLTVNGTRYALEVPANHTLLDVLRLHLGLTGTKESCLEGRCGACTVLLNGDAVTSCLILGPAVSGSSVLTIEGLSGEDGLHPLQEAFIEHAAAQCGYCTPGMIMSAKALLDRVPVPSEQQIRRALHGNICRCTGYTQIIEAVRAAGQQMVRRQNPRAPVPKEGQR